MFAFFRPESTFQLFVNINDIRFPVDRQSFGFKAQLNHLDDFGLLRARHRCQYHVQAGKEYELVASPTIIKNPRFPGPEFILRQPTWSLASLF